MERLRKESGPATRVVCLSFERFGEGSDADRSFQKGAFFAGDMYRVEQAQVYAPLFGRKGLLQGFGLGSGLAPKRSSCITLVQAETKSATNRSEASLWA
jgi:hypothetical protein